MKGIDPGDVENIIRGENHIRMPKQAAGGWCLRIYPWSCDRKHDPFMS